METTSAGSETTEQARLFAPFPSRGPWTALGLTRGQFFGILGGSCLIFLLWGGALWSHVGGRDFGRLATSYAVIPLAVAAALRHNGRLRWPLLLAASGTIAVLKLLITASIDLVLGIALGAH